MELFLAVEDHEVRPLVSIVDGHNTLAWMPDESAALIQVNSLFFNLGR